MRHIAILLVLVLAGPWLASAAAVDTTCPSPNEVCPDWWRPPYFTGGAHPDGYVRLVIDTEAEWADFRAKHGGHMLPELDLATSWAVVALDPETPGTSASVRVQSVTREPVTGAFQVVIVGTNTHVEGLGDLPVSVRPADMAIVERLDAAPVDAVLVDVALGPTGAGGLDLPEL